MEELNICPSTLTEGFSTYSPAALKQLFDGEQGRYILKPAPTSYNLLERKYCRKHSTIAA